MQQGYGFESDRSARSEPATLDEDRLPPFVGIFIAFELFVAVVFTAAIIGLGYLLGLAIYEAVQIADWVRAAW